MMSTLNAGTKYIHNTIQFIVTTSGSADSGTGSKRFAKAEKRKRTMNSYQIANLEYGHEICCEHTVRNKTYT